MSFLSESLINFTNTVNNFATSNGTALGATNVAAQFIATTQAQGASFNPTIAKQALNSAQFATLAGFAVLTQDTNYYTSHIKSQNFASSANILADLATVAGDVILIQSDSAALAGGKYQSAVLSKVGLAFTFAGIALTHPETSTAVVQDIDNAVSSVVKNGVSAVENTLNTTSPSSQSQDNSSGNSLNSFLDTSLNLVKSIFENSSSGNTAVPQSALVNVNKSLLDAAATADQSTSVAQPQQNIGISPSEQFLPDGSPVISASSPTGSSSYEFDITNEQLINNNYNLSGLSIGSGLSTFNTMGYSTYTAFNSSNSTGNITGLAISSPNYFFNLEQNAAGTYDLTQSTGNLITLSGVQSISADSLGGYQILNSLGASYNLDPTGAGGIILKSKGYDSIIGGLQDVTTLQFGSSLQLNLSYGGIITVNPDTGAVNYVNDGINSLLGSGNLYVGNDLLGISSSLGEVGTLFNEYTPSANGQIRGDGGDFFVGSSSTAGSATQLASASSSLESAVDTVDPISTPTGPLSNDVIPELAVNPLSSVINTGSQAADTSSIVPGGLVASGADYGVAFGWTAGTPVSAETSANNIANLDGVFNNSPPDIVTGDYRPGNAAVQAPSQNETILITDETQAQYTAYLDATDPDTQEAVGKELAANVLASYATTAPTLASTDPLLVDLTGNGIQLSNWIDNLVLFDTNVEPVLTSAGTQAYNANGSPEYSSPDEVQTGTSSQGAPVYKLTDHQTSWMEAGTGMLVYDPSAGAITNITQTVSQFLNVGYGIGQFATSSLTAADGLQALANLATPGATVFSAATSLLDAKNNNTPYWNEIMVGTGQPVLNADGTTSIPTTQLQTLAQAGIASINLAGTGNQGESIAGSAVTNQSTYTSTTGTTNEVAAVDFQTNTTGDVTLPGNGDDGLVINSIPEGGVSSSNSYLDQNSTARSFKLYDGTLGDLTNNVVIASSLVGFFVSGQNDTITVAAGDTSSYWLSGGTSAATLDASQASGNIMFLVNAQTTIKGGSGFNIAQVTDNGPISINLAADNLQEVVGGAGDGTFNASGTNYNVFIQGGSGNNIIIGGGAHDALSGGTGDDLIQAGNGGSVIHAGSGNDVIYGGSGETGSTPNSDIIYGGPGQNTVILGTNNSDVFAGTGSMTVIGQVGVFSVVSFHGSYADYTVTQNADGSETVTDKNPDQDGPVTVKGVADFDFADINQLATNLVAGLAVNDTVSISGSSPYVIQSSTLLANDIDYAGDALAISNLLDVNGNSIAPGKSGPVNGGTAALSSDGSSITFTPTAGFSGIPSFEYNLQGGETLDQVSATGAIVGTPTPLAATVTLLSPTMPTDPGIADEYYLAAADVLPAWQAGYTGAGVSVAVFDPSGNADFTNPDLTANGVAEYQNAGVPGIAQIGTHATLVAGVIAAARDGEGQIGVAYGASLTSEATAPGSSTGTQLTASIEPWKNYDVVNNSWGPSGGPFSDQFGLVGGSNVQQAFTDAVTAGRGGLGTIIVFAGGNTATSNTNDYNLTNSPDEIVVGGVDPTAGSLGTLETPSARFATPGASILVSAPDQFIATTGALETNEYGEQFGSTSETEAGTSLAAPIVSGVVALMLQANPTLGYQDVQQILAYTAKQVSDPNTTWSTNGATNWNGGGLHTSNSYGFGEVDAAAAVRLAKTWTDITQNENYAGGSLVVNEPLGWGPSFTATLPAGPSGATVQHFQVSVDLWDANLSDLTITLTAPNGVGSTLMSQPQNVTYTGTAYDQNGIAHQDFNYTFDTVQDLGASLFGSWTVSITGSQGASEPGTVQSVSFLPEIDNPVAAYIYTDEFGSAAASLTDHSSTLTDSGTNVTLNASAVSTGMVLDLRPGSTDSVIAGQALEISANTTVKTVDGGAGNDTITANDAGDTIVAGAGNDTIKGGAGKDNIVLDGGSATVDGGGGVNTVVFTSSDTVPDETWAVSENSSGAIVTDGTNAGYSGNATLTRIQTVEIGDSTFDLVGAPVAGGTTKITTPTDNAAGVVVADGAGNDTLLFGNAGTSYWHAGGGTDTATLAAGTTNIYLEGSASQYTISGMPPGRLTVVDKVANRNGTKTIIAGAGTGNLVFSDGSTIPIPKSTVQSDFNGDGKSDILFQNKNGTIYNWLMNGTTILSSSVIADPGPSWHAVGTGDFNGDGKSDILFQNDNGAIDIWQMNGGAVAYSSIVANPGSSWRPVGIGDFNGDGKSDILFQANNGAIDIWQMNGNSVAYSSVVANPGPSWHPLGIGDFNGDGKSDIVFQNDNGAVDIWEMNGNSIAAGVAVADPGTAWRPIGVGDFNGDGTSDILFQNKNGAIDIWEMNGTTVGASSVVANPGQAWHAVSVGDFDGDGKSDILFQNDNGAIDIWKMNGLSVASSAIIANPGLNWQSVGLGSMHFINGTESSGTIAGTILNDDFVFTTSLPGSHVITNFDPAHDMLTLNQSRFGSFSAVQMYETSNAGGTTFALTSTSTLTIQGVLPTMLSAKNFI